MKHRILFPLLMVAVLLAASVVSCSKEDEGPDFGASVNSVEQLTSLGIYTPSSPDFFSNNSWTTGLTFTSSKKGRITHLGAKLAKGSYVAALWDSTAQTVLVSVTVNVTDSTQFAYTDILDVPVEANKVYIVTVNNKPSGLDYRNYWVYYINNSADYLPQTLGDITIRSNTQKQTDDPLSMFPVEYNVAFYFAGIPGFKFQPEL